MKVLHVIPSLSPLRGGPSFAAKQMARSLGVAGLDITVATTDDDGPGRRAVPLRQPVTEEGYATWYFPRQSRFYTFSWPLTSWLAKHIHEYDLVHIHSLFSYASLPAAYWAARRRVPYILRPIGTLQRWGMRHRRAQLKRISFQCIERRMLSRAAAVHYTSEQEQLEARELGVSAPAFVIPLGIDSAQFQRQTKSNGLVSCYPQLSGRTVLLFLSRVHPIKGLDILLPAFAKMHANFPETILIIAGDGEEHYLAHLRQMAMVLGIDAAIIWTGFLDGEDKLAAFGVADLFILPSYSENFGVVVTEALAAGLPVILTDQVGIAPQVERCEAGLVVGCEESSLELAMSRLVAHPAERIRMGGNGKSLAHDEFSLAAMARSLIDMYDDILRRCIEE